MAGVGAYVNSANAVVALSGGTAQTVLQLVAGSNQAGMIDGYQTTFDGTSSTATPGLNQIVQQSTAGTMSAATPVKAPRSDEGETLQLTAQYHATAEPTSGNVQRMFHCHSQLGFIYEFPFGGTLKCPGGGRTGIKSTYAAAVNILPSFWYTE
jgi:hypothetical protein